ncbi:MAG: hypothetical protein P8Y12_00355 [Gammaproteobacteria bacterium]|jgi:hypothetical protein
MGNLKTGHIVEAVLWLTLVVVLYVYSFEFDKEIEIYKFGASTWPRAILLLIAIAAIGQLFYHWKTGDGGATTMIGQASEDGAEEAAHESHHDSAKWYAWTFALLAIPFIYMNLPEWIAALMSLEKTGLHSVKLICAALLVVIYLIAIRGNHVGGILALPILFAAFLQDFGFYAMAPVFILGVMYLFGEQRYKHMLVVMAGLFALLLMFFVSLLYVGLPTGNIRPFYDFGTGLVNILQ